MAPVVEKEENADTKSASPSTQVSKISSPLPPRSFCWDCGKEASTRCAICKVAYYCGKDCQKTAWVYEHKIRCSPDRALLKNISDCYDYPDIPLVPRERIEARLLWRWSLPYNGAGLLNRYNICWMNSALQCLIVTPPIGNTVIQRLHGRTCKSPKGCVYCEFEKFALTQYLSAPNSLNSARFFIENITKISSSFTLGRHEDAHEFFRHLIEALQACILKQSPLKLEHRLAETSIIYQPFCGYLQSEVVCASCGYGSKTYDAFLDISLDFQTETTLENALRVYTSPQALEAKSYRCDNCKEKVNARRRLTIDTAPPILTIHLKRFNYYGGKVCSEVSFPAQLNIQQYMSISKRNQELNYNLYAVLVHAGRLASFGHYYCYVKRNLQPWLEIDDHTVREVKEEEVLRQKTGAYILFYCRDIPDPDAVKLQELKNISFPRANFTEPGMKAEDVCRKLLQVPKLMTDEIKLPYRSCRIPGFQQIDVDVGVVESVLDLSVEVMEKSLCVSVYDQLLQIPLETAVSPASILTQYLRKGGCLRIYIPESQA
eukprot:TRINITY_DN3222_c0_g2_i1.p1 TRINITY_DN3222_c0_g2~~TRINITY_DN3222_c0_g2_i1.p1  ORF type:complete len:545 (+),score=78.04 TRINITY_DN3222_c0_g2_i1:47-1681(+)